MKPIAMVVLCVLALTPVALAQAPAKKETAKAKPAPSAAEEVQQTERRYIEALLKKDLATLEHIWADDYTFTNGQGIFLTKAERLNNIKTRATEFQASDESDQQVRVYGDTAVLTSHVLLKARYSGQEGSGPYRHIAVYVKGPHGWQMVANQITRTAK